MDWFPLCNSIRIAAVSTVVVFFLGIFAAYYIAKTPRLVKGVLDVFLTLPLVLPPTVVGYLLKYLSRFLHNLRNNIPVISIVNNFTYIKMWWWQLN